MARISHMTFDSKGPRRGLLGWIAGKPAKASVQASEDGSATTPAEPPLQASAEPPASSPSSSPADGSDDFPPLNLLKIGDTIQIDRSPDEQDEWTGEDFAGLFLRWITHTFPATEGNWVSSYDLEFEYFDRFLAAEGCPHLEFGTLARGLTKLLGRARKRERRCMYGTGKPYWKTEYKIPMAVSNVVSLAEREAS